MLWVKMIEKGRIDAHRGERGCQARQARGEGSGHIQSRPSTSRKALIASRNCHRSATEAERHSTMRAGHPIP